MAGKNLSQAPNACPDRAVLFAFHTGELSGDLYVRIAPHIESCSTCLDVLASLDDSRDPLLAYLRKPVPAELFSEAARQPMTRLVETNDAPHADKEPDAGNNNSFQVGVLNKPSGIPRQVGKYEVVRRLGSGGQASAYLAFDPDLKRHVVLKIFHSVQTPEERETVLREGQALARVHSPYVARCHHAECHEGVPYLVVEHIPGKNLAELHRARPLPLEQALELLRQLAEGLAAVHACGLLHRDVKPSNIIVGDDDLPYLVDFGLAVPLASDELRQVSGTPAYMAPEQARGESERIDPRTDLFGLGAVLYELVAGRSPYRADNRNALWEAARIGEVIPPLERNPQVPAAVNELCLRLLAREPRNRPASAREVAETIRGIQAQIGVPTKEPFSPAPPQPTRRRGRWLAAAVLLLVVLLAVGIGLSVHFARTRPGTPDDPGLPVSATLDIRIWKTKESIHSLALSDPNALPLHAGDYVRVEGELNRPAYLYLIYLDAAGKGSPLYPWRGDWNDRPAEQPRASLHLPEDPLKDAAPLQPGKSGIEAVVLLVRDAPLSEEENTALARLFADAPRQGKFDPLRGAVWLVDGRDDRFGNDRDRGRPTLDRAAQVEDPVERVRRLMRGELRHLCQTSRAVCFPFQGD